MSRLAVLSLKVTCELVMEAKLNALMVEVRESRKELEELEEKFSSSLNEMKREVNTAQERTTVFEADRLLHVWVQKEGLQISV